MSSFGPPLDRGFYESLRDARPRFRQVDGFTIALEERGRGFVVGRGHSFRIACVEAPQVADVCFWNANNHRERFWNDQSLLHEGVYLTTFNRLWSNLPCYRPMLTIIEDTVAPRHHTLLGAHCNGPEWRRILGDDKHDFVTKYNCHENLGRAVDPFGLSPDDLHDNVNLFQKIHYDVESDRFQAEPSEAERGDYIEFYAEIDVLVAASLCPSGAEGTVYGNLEDESVSPLAVEIYETGVEPLGFETGRPGEHTGS